MLFFKRRMRKKEEEEEDEEEEEEDYDCTMTRKAMAKTDWKCRELTKMLFGTWRISVVNRLREKKN